MPKVSTNGSTATATKPSNKAGKGKKAKVQESREIIYPKKTVNDCSGENALTVDQAKVLLGWQEEGEGESFGNDFFIKDREGKKIRCLNNVSNRPFVKGNCETMVQEILNKRWRDNGDAISIGKTGVIISGQHRLVALALAEQDRTGGDRFHWSDIVGWEGPVTIECTIIRGIEETDDVINTVDTGRPRSLSDVLYRSGYFEKLKGPDRKALSDISAYTVQVLWDRTGMKDDPYAPFQTHSEAVDFIQRHLRLIKAAQHIWEENGGQERLIAGPFKSLGLAAALMYLMGQCESDPEKHEDKDGVKSEKKLDWSQWDKATDFWVELNSAKLKVVRDALIDLQAGSEGCMGATKEERSAIAILAWDLFRKGKKVTPKDLALRYKTTSEGILTGLLEPPTLGGIDLGFTSEREDEEQEETETEPRGKAGKGNVKEVDPTPEQIKERKAEEKAKALEAKKNGKPKTRKEIEADQTEKARLADEEDDDFGDDDEDSE